MDWLSGTIIVFAILTTITNLLILLKFKFKIFKKNKKYHNQEPSQELLDFLSDIKVHGFGVVRIDPSNVFYRSSRGKE